MDYVATTQLVEMTRSYDHQHANLVLQFQEFLRRNWKLQLIHIYPEGNFLADHLPLRGHNLPFGSHDIDVFVPPVAF
ncbi:hypothetical protein LINGRAHAP2_LOCUS4423 [Linum grandiflorum]